MFTRYKETFLISLEKVKNDIEYSQYLSVVHSIDRLKGIISSNYSIEQKEIQATQELVTLLIKNREGFIYLLLCLSPEQSKTIGDMIIRTLGNIDLPLIPNAIEESIDDIIRKSVLDILELLPGDSTTDAPPPDVSKKKRK